jgi:hypothetical protein
MRSRAAGRAFSNNQRSFFHPQFSIHLKEALAQRISAIAAKPDLITTSFAGQQLWPRPIGSEGIAQVLVSPLCAP